MKKEVRDCFVLAAKDEKKGKKHKGLLTTRLRKSETIKKQAILCLFRHNLYAILRIKAGQESLLLPN